jgi:hypothetical protein
MFESDNTPDCGLWSNGRRRSLYLFDIHVVKVVLHKLHAGIEVSGIEFIWNVPSQGSKLPSLLDHGVHEGHTIQHGLPLRHVGNIEEILAKSSVGSLQASLNALWGLVGEFNGNLLKQ